MNLYQVKYFRTLLIYFAVIFSYSCTPKPEPFLLGLLALPNASENAAFQVLTTIPTLDQTDVSISSSVIVNFNKNVDSSTIAGNVSLTQPSSNSIASISATTSGKVVTLKPSSSFLSTSSYTFTFKSNIKATTGETLGTDYSLKFMTQ